MKKLIYGSILVICALISFTLLVLYYTQDFSEEMSFISSLSTKDINYSYSGDSINDLHFKLGEVSLDNNGYFEKVYEFPKIVWCATFKNGEYLTNYPLYVYYSGENSLGKYSREVMSQDNKVTIDVGEIRKFYLFADYSGGYSNEYSLSQLQENVQVISLYKIDKKEDNPFGNSYYSYDYTSCSQLELDSKPVKVIPFLH